MADPPDNPAQEPEEPEEEPELSQFAHPDLEVSQDFDPEARRYPSTIGGAAYLMVLGGTLAGLAIVTTGRWRMGVLWIGCSLLGAAAARLVLPEHQAGMLHVRRRLVDVVLLVGLGAGLLISAAAIPTR